MPAAIPYLASAAATALGASAFVATVVTVATSLLVAGYQRDKLRRQQRGAAAAEARNRTVTVRSGVAPRKIVLGTARLSGPLMYAEFVGPEEEYFDSIVALNHGEISELVGVYADDEYIPASDISATVPTSGKYSAGAANADRRTETHTITASATVTLDHPPSELDTIYPVLTSGEGDSLSQLVLVVSTVVGNVLTLSAPVTGDVVVSYTTRATVDGPLRLQWTTGTASQASTTWAGVSTPKWTTDHRLRGVAYLRALMRMEDNVYATGTPNLSAVVRGPKGVYDPRTSTTLDYTSNPALLAAWFRTLPRADGGMGVPSGWIDWPSVATAANVCDELISVKKLDGSGYENVKRYECHTVLTLDQAPADNLRVILEAMAGEFPFTGSMYRCYAGAFRAAAVTLTDADVAADAAITVAPLSGGDQVPPNTASGTFWNAATGWTETGARQVSNAAYITEDGAEEVMELDLPATTDERQANYLMGLQLERARPGLSAALTVNGRGANIGLMDTLQLNLSGYSALAGRTFEVRRRSNDWRGRYPLELREVRATTYALDADRFTPATPITKPDNSALFRPAPVELTAVTNDALLQSDGTYINRALVTWTTHPQSFVREGGVIELRWQRPGAEWVQVPPVQGSAVQAYIGPLDDGAIIYIEARARNGLGAVSEWTGIAPHTVQGKMAPPANVTGLAYEIVAGGLRLSWNPCTDIDYASTVLKYGATWATAAQFWQGKSSDFTVRPPGDATYVVWAAHVDTSGNLSATPASITVPYVAMAEGVDGDSVIIEYSVNGSTAWHTTFTTGDLYTRWKVGTAGAWNGPWRIVGEAGSAGDYKDFIFKRSASAPSTPTGATPAGWFDSPPAADGNPLWVSYADKTAAGALIGAWSTPVQIEGASGDRSAVVYLYRRSASAPALPTTSTTYSFTTNTPSGMNNSWSATIPAGTDPLYVTAATATAAATATSDTIAAGEWATPVILVQDGADGADGAKVATVRIYRRTTTSSTPALPSLSSTYTFADGSMTGLNNSWTAAVPASGGAYLWTSQATALSTSTGDTILAAEWSAAVLMSQDGAAGSQGTSAARAYALYSGNPTVTGAAVVRSGNSLPLTTSWSPTAATAWSSTVQTPGTGQAMFQSDGLFDPVANQTTWGTPYLSNFKVGSLSAISADMGTLTAGNINTNGYINANGTSTFTLEDPLSYPLPGSSKTISIAANNLGGAQVGVVGIGHLSGGYGVYAYNDANAPALVGMTNSASTTSAACILRSVNGYGLQVLGGSNGGVFTLTNSSSGAALIATSSGPGTRAADFATGGVGSGATNIACKLSVANSADLALSCGGKSTFTDRITSTIAGTNPFMVVPRVSAKPTAIAGGIALHSTYGLIVSDGTNWYAASALITVP